MSFHKDVDGYLVFECNDCGREFEANCREFGRAVMGLKDYGWLIQPHTTQRGGKVWHHFCPQCRWHNAA